MFRDKNFLIKKGMYPNCRKDVFYLVGYFYDDYMNDIFDEEKVEEQRKYLDQHRELIDNEKDYDITLLETIKKRLGELKRGPLLKKEKKKKEFNNQVNLSYDDKTGIYGIYIDNQLIYIGKTITSFKIRFKQHFNNIQDEYNHKERVYDIIRKAKKENKKIELKPILILEDLKLKNKNTINNKELQCMEMALIATLKPIGNIEGVYAPYVFHNNVNKSVKLSK